MREKLIKGRELNYLTCITEEFDNLEYTLRCLEEILKDHDCDACDELRRQYKPT
jgi:hypothetical protein